jgi:hypothetical protein
MLLHAIWDRILLILCLVLNPQNIPIFAVLEKFQFIVKLLFAYIVWMVLSSTTNVWEMFVDPLTVWHRVSATDEAILQSCSFGIAERPARVALALDLAPKHVIQVEECRAQEEEPGSEIIMKTE